MEKYLNSKTNRLKYSYNGNDVNIDISNIYSVIRSGPFIKLHTSKFRNKYYEIECKDLTVARDMFAEISDFLDKRSEEYSTLQSEGNSDNWKNKTVRIQNNSMDKVVQISGIHSPELEELSVSWRDYNDHSQTINFDINIDAKKFYQLLLEEVKNETNLVEL